MRRTLVRSALVLGSILALACNDADTTTDDGDVTGSGGNGAAQGPGAGPSTGPGAGKGASTNAAATTSGAGGGQNLAWTELVAADWSLDPFSEDTSRLGSRTLDRDIYVGAIRPIAPPGTHHTLLGRGDVLANAIYASGVGTNAVIFPEGVGLKLSKDETIVLQLHIFNPVGDPLAGRSGIEIVEVDPANVTQQATIFLPGPTNITLPPQQQTTISGTCQINQAQQIFALFPHMHQLGTHFKTVLTVGGSEMVLHDEPYDFTHQPFIPFAPIALSPGDTVRTECTYTNMTTNEVHWGESSDAEMCFSILYRIGGGGGGFCN